MRPLRPLALALSLLAVLAGAVPARAEVAWTDYAPASGAFTCRLPEGWTVEESGSTLVARAPDSGEQIVVAVVPSEAPIGAATIGAAVIRSLQRSAPDLAATEWSEVADANGQAVTTTFTYTEEGVARVGAAVVAKLVDRAIWFSCTAPGEGLPEGRIAELLGGVVASFRLPEGSGPVEPPPPLPRRVERDGRAFVFVLAFALNAPFPMSSEEAILRAFAQGSEEWGDAQWRQNDSYTGLAAEIVLAEPDRLEALRLQLAEGMRAWLAEAPADDAAATAVRAQLEACGQSLSEGDPPLPRAAATSYAELRLYLGALNQRRAVSLDEIDPQVATVIRDSVVQAWGDSPAEERRAVLAAPAIWAAVRGTSRYGLRSESEELSALLLANLEPDLPRGEGAPEPVEGLSAVGRTLLDLHAGLAADPPSPVWLRWASGFAKLPLGWAAPPTDAPR